MNMTSEGHNGLSSVTHALRGFFRPQHRLSMFELLTTHESERAAQQGWQLSWVVEESKTLVQILPSWQVAQIKSAEQAYRLVMTLAKTNDPTALRALQLCVRSRQPAAAKKAARRKKQ